MAGGGQTARPPSCSRASEPAAPPSRLLTLNILVRTECGERAENIPPRRRGEHLSPPSPPPPPLCAGAPAGRRPRLQRPVPPHRTGGHGEGEGLGTTCSVVTCAQSYTASERNALHIRGKKGRGGRFSVCVNAAARPIAGRPFKGLPVRPNEESPHLHAAARGQAAAGRECRGAPGLPRPGLREGRSEPPRPELRGGGAPTAPRHGGPLLRGARLGRREPRHGVRSSLVLSAGAPQRARGALLHPKRQFLFLPGAAPSPRRSSASCQRGGRRRLPSAPASVSHLPCAEAPRGRCGATAGAGVLAAQVGGAQRFPPRRGAAPGEGTELLHFPALPPPARPAGGAASTGMGARPVRPGTAVRALPLPGPRLRPLLRGHRDSSKRPVGRRSPRASRGSCRVSVQQNIRN